MTREKFIKKWLGNKDYQYTEENRDLMRDDLDKVINQALRQPPVIKSVCTCMAFHKSDECYKLGCKAHRSDEVQTVL